MKQAFRSKEVHRVHLWAMVLFCFAMGVSACASVSDSRELDPVTVQLSWIHQAEFAGFYAAEQLGYYAEEGLDVSLIEGGPEVNFMDPVIHGAAHFGVAQPADLILARAEGRPVRSIAVLYRRSPIVFFSLADSGITRPQEFRGQTIRSTSNTDWTLRALMNKVGISPDQYELVNLPSDVELFASGDVPIWSGYINIFALEVQRGGYDLNLIFPDDYGIHFYGNILITTDDLIEKDAGLVQRFLRATLRGWTHVVENPNSVGAFVQQYNPEADTALENARMIASIPLVNTGEDFIGWMKPEVWSAMEQTLREQGILTAPLKLEDVYTMQFVEEIYER